MAMKFIINPPPVPAVDVAGTDEYFPVHRLYCVGQNYAAHAREMGSDSARVPPFFFSKPPDAVVENGASVPYPPGTKDLHHEIELVVAIGRGGANISLDDSLDCIFGYAVGNDLTRRDLQAVARKSGGPWDVAKGFDHSAPLSAIRRVAEVGHLRQGDIWLEVNGERRQQACLSDMIWSVPEIIAELSTWFELKPGDLIFTGTPAGVGPVVPGDSLVGGVDGLETLRTTIV